MPDTPHIIARQEVRLRCDRAADEFALRQQLLSLCSDELPTRLNALLDRYNEDGMVLRIGKIVVAVTLDDDTNLCEGLTKAVTEQVERALRQQLGQSMTRGLSVGGSLLEALRFYVVEGYLPWWTLHKEAHAFREACRDFLRLEMPPHSAQAVLQLLRQSDARSRFVRLAGVEGIESLLSQLPVFSAGRWQLLKSSLMLISERRDGASEQRADWEKLIGYTLGAAIEALSAEALSLPEFLKQLSRQLRRASYALPAQPAIELPLQEWRQLLEAGTISDAPPHAADIAAARSDHSHLRPLATDEMLAPNDGKDGDQRVLIGSAGLVILAPFLPAFFKSLGWLEEAYLTQPARSVSALHYVLSGNDAADEIGLVFEKILCGLPVRQSLDLPCLLSEAEKEEATALLQSVIQHWSMLKSTSPDGLRHNFLQREGRLLFKAGQWELTVQKQTHDILLDYLPWTIGMIKLPWMKTLLITKWNT